MEDSLCGLEAGNKISVFNWDNLRIANIIMRDPHVWYFSGLADRVDLLPVEPNPRAGRTIYTRTRDDTIATEEQISALTDG